MSMSYVVTRVSKSLVSPSVPTPNETLNLSAIDRVPGLRHGVRSIHVFKHGHEPGKVIKEALSKALVLYYPFAGRFVDPDSSAGEVTVACTGEGAYFIEATANCSLENVNYLDLPLMIPEHQLLPDAHPEVAPLNMPLMMQVTEFTCGGFTVGIISIHSIADGLGAAQFINAIAELARGLDKPTKKPLRHREIIPNPSKLPAGPPVALNDLKLVNSTFDISLDSINRIKTQYLNEMGNYCSTFDISVAKAWQARTRAIKLEDNNAKVHICFFANTRQYLKYQRMTSEAISYYGNCFYPVTVSAASGEVANAELVELVKLIKEAKARLANDFVEWGRGGMKENPYELSVTYNCLFVSDWTKLGFQEVDYGWGTPVNVIPFAYCDYMAVAILGSPPAPNNGARLMTQCVVKAHLDDFVKQMTTF